MYFPQKLKEAISVYSNQQPSCVFRANWAVLYVVQTHIVYHVRDGVLQRDAGIHGHHVQGSGREHLTAFQHGFFDSANQIEAALQVGGDLAFQRLDNTSTSKQVTLPKKNGSL